MEAVLNGVPSSTKFTYHLPEKWEHLFDSRQDEDDFKGFTKDDLYVICKLDHDLAGGGGLGTRLAAPHESHL